MAYAVQNLPPWLAPALVAAAAVILALRRALPPMFIWIAAESLLTAAISIPLINHLPYAGGTIQKAAAASALIALLWSSCGTVATWLRRRHDPLSSDDRPFTSVTHVVALLLGVSAAIVFSVLLTMRAIVVGMELLFRMPWDGLEAAHVGLDGVYFLGCLLLACLIALPSAQSAKLETCAFWCAVLMACWICLQMPPLRTGPTGTDERTLLPVFLSAALAMVVAITIATMKRRPSTLGPYVLENNAPRQDTTANPYAGLSASLTLVSVGLLLLTCFNLAIPPQMPGGGFRLPALLLSVSALLAGSAGIIYLRQVWSLGVADTAVGLLSLGLCGLATLLVPDKTIDLAMRYPMIFNAMLVGSSAAAALCTLGALGGDRSPAGNPADALLARMTPYLKRFAFLNGALALVASALMAAWPRWPGVSATDDSIERVLAGVAAQLFHLLVMLWCSRRLKRFTLQMLTVLSMIAAAAFLIVRIFPFTPGFA